jgi:hypothetical protein
MGTYLAHAVRGLRTHALLSAAAYLPCLRTNAEFRSKGIYKLAVVYRDDVLELRSMCEGVVSQAKATLLTVSLEVHYSNSSNATIAGVMDQVAASPVEALIMCGLAVESTVAADMLHQRRKPLKAIVFTSGPYDRYMR